MAGQCSPALDRRLYLTVFLVSATALAYEILLIRLLSIIQWHHFAYMIISLALLGYGAGGTVLTIGQERLVPACRSVVPYCCLLFGLAIPVCFLLAQRLEFNAEAFFWDWRQLPRLFEMYLLLAVPFFFAALVIAILLRARPAAISLLYACDLSGAAVGGIGILLLLFVVYPEKLLLLLPLGGLAAAAVSAGASSVKKTTWTTVALAALVLNVMPESFTALRPSEYKGLPQLLRVQGTRVVARKSGPLADLRLVESPRVPLRHAPGLSLAAEQPIPEQLALFGDNDMLGAVNRYEGGGNELSFLDQTTSALAYHLKKPGKVAILGAGTGGDVLQALYHGVNHVEAVELNSQVIDLVKENGVFAGDIYHNARVKVHVAEGRSFIRESGENYDVLQLSLFDSFSSSAAGLHGLQENYLYTVEALADYIKHLAPDGFLSISRWVRVPPRDGLKIFATALEALESLGVANPGSRLLLIRGWQTCTLLVKNGAIEGGEIEKARQFCNRRYFDLAYYPGMQRQEANRYNILAEPFFYAATQQLLSDKRQEFIQRYKFDLRPATDDRPYFFDFFKWRTLPELMRLKGRGGLAQVEWGYFTLAVTLGQAILASALLVLLPLYVSKAVARPAGGPGTVLRVFGYFGAIGLAFLFLEICFIQKCVLFLHHPLYAAALVISIFLIFAGLGSRVAGKIDGNTKSHLRLAVGGIAVLCLLYIFAFHGISEALLHVALPVRILATILLLAPIAFCMGMPFPIALSHLNGIDARLIPWAWAVNGCASVISAVLAMLLGVHLGFNAVIGCAVLLYMVAPALLPGPSKKDNPTGFVEIWS